MRSSWPGYSSSSSAARTNNAPEAIAGQNVQIGDKGPPVLLGRPCEPRNHAVFFRRCGSGPSLCIRSGHDPAHFLRGRTGRAALVRDVVWAEGPLGRGHSTSTGAVHAFGDRMAVPERVTCPRLEWLAAGRAAFIRRETVVARRIKPWCRAAFQETAWKGDAEDGGPAALGLAHAQAAAQGLHAAPRPLHVRPDEPQ